ncbi:Ig-like domain-containing protein [Luteolibacter flavescens]|uniref:Ig-like domain-containing protein n=1 Tax=Luteolibacter flavescens TaxID=1859460 RepID=UPI003CCE141E
MARLHANDVRPEGQEVVLDGIDTTSSQGVPLSLVGEEIHYTPGAAVTGTDRFTYPPRNSAGVSSTATVTLLPRPVCPGSHHRPGWQGHAGLPGHPAAKLHHRTLHRSEWVDRHRHPLQRCRRLARLHRRRPDHVPRILQDRLALRGGIICPPFLRGDPSATVSRNARITDGKTGGRRMPPMHHNGDPTTGLALGGVS